MRLVRAVCVISAGFAEVGGEGRALQDELRRRARVAGVRLIGPNCTGRGRAAANKVLTGQPGGGWARRRHRRRPHPPHRLTGEADAPLVRRPVPPRPVVDGGLVMT
jgi:hypothetical protein